MLLLFLNSVCWMLGRTRSWTFIHFPAFQVLCVVLSPHRLSYFFKMKTVQDVLNIFSSNTCKASYEPWALVICFTTSIATPVLDWSAKIKYDQPWSTSGLHRSPLRLRAENAWAALSVLLPIKGHIDLVALHKTTPVLFPSRLQWLMSLLLKLRILSCYL